MCRYAYFKTGMYRCKFDGKACNEPEEECEGLRGDEWLYDHAYLYDSLQEANYEGHYSYS